MRVRYLRQALADLEDIAFYIANDSVDAAARTIHVIRTKLNFLPQFPAAGRQRDELAKGLRSWPIGSYVVYYRIAKREVQIVRVMHGHQDPQGPVWDLPSGEPAG